MNGPIATSVKLATSAVLTVPKNTAIYTDPIELAGVNEFCLIYQAAGTGSPSVKIEMQQAINLPAVANAADANWVVPESVADIVTTLTDKNVHIQAISPVCVKYIRFKITELTNVMTDLVMTMSLSVQAKFAN